METSECRILIVGTGPSAEGADLSNVSLRSVITIAVNGAIRWVPQPDFFFSLDPSTAVRELIATPRKGVRYYMAVPPDYGTPRARIMSHRAPRESHVTFLERVEGDGVRGARERLSERSGAIHTGNSVWGALGFAYRHPAVEKIGFLGLDGTCEPYAYGAGKPRNPFDHLPDLFASAVPQLEARGIQVMNGSPNSLITCFPRCNPSELVDWLIG